MISVSGGATLAVNCGGQNDWAMADINTLRANAAFAPGSSLGFDTTNANGPIIFGDPIAGVMGLGKFGAGTLTLGGANTYTGPTTLSPASLTSTMPRPLARAHLRLPPIARSTTLAAGSIALSTNNPMTWGGNFTFVGTQDLDLGTGPVTLGGNRTATVATNTLTVGGAISGAYSLMKVGTGTLTLGGANSYTGGTILNAGQLNINNAQALGSGTFTIAANSTIDNTDAGSIALSTNNPMTWGGNFTFVGTQNLNLGNGAITPSRGIRAVTVKANTLTVGGVISGGIFLVKAGTGTLVLSGANSYTGLTTVAGGTLELGPAAQNCVLNLGGANIQSGKIVFDYAAGADPVATIQSLLKASYDRGRWDIGQLRDSTAAITGLTLACFDDTSLYQVKVMATYPGDFNLDGAVDNLDRAIWFANAFTGTTWQQGDANYDGAVDGLIEI